MIGKIKTKIKKNKTLPILILTILILAILGWPIYSYFCSYVINSGLFIEIHKDRIVHLEPITLFFSLATSFFFLLGYFFLIRVKTHINLIITILSFIGVLLVLICTSRYGVGLSPDSVVYISVARNLILGKGYLDWAGNPLIVFPPLFSTILAAIGLTGMDPLYGARFLNVIIFGLIIFTSGQLFRKFIQTKEIIILGTISVLFSIPIFLVSYMAWSEPLFILLVNLFIFCLYKFINKARWSTLILLSAIAALSCLQRYIGVTLIISGFISIFLLLPKSSFLQRLKYGIIFSIISTSIFSIWPIRNYILTQTFFGTRFPSDFTLLQNIYYTFDTLTLWFLPSNMPFLIRGITVGLLILLIITLTFYRYLKSNEEGINRIRQVLPAGIFLLVYTIFLIISGARFAFDRINLRLLSPIYIFTIFLILVNIENLLILLPYQQVSKKILRFTVYTIFIFSLFYPLTYNIYRVIHSRQSGIVEYSTQAWRKSSLILWLQEHKLDAAIASNVPEAIYIHTGKKSNLSPKKHEHDSSASKGDNLYEIKEKLKLTHEKIYLVWFKNIARDFLYNIEELSSVFNLQEIINLSDGIVYSLE
ncbi:MAG: hypothetical protein WAQ07_01240 [Candidatus Omnitrophota bacterium]